MTVDVKLTDASRDNGGQSRRDIGAEAELSAIAAMADAAYGLWESIRGAIAAVDGEPTSGRFGAVRGMDYLIDELRVRTQIEAEKQRWRE